jgi:methionyl aminopeptidase
MKQFSIKTPAEIGVMAEGGRMLREIKEELVRSVSPGVDVADIEKLADHLIAKTGGRPSFKMVPGYSWATCININEEVVHAIPKARKIKEGDIVGIDVGLFYRGWHLDTSVTVGAGKIERQTEAFLETGRKVLKMAIKMAKPGKKIADLSRAMQGGIEGSGYSVVRALTGHGIGKQLHGGPAIPCFDLGSYEDSVEIVSGMVLAIEVMYNMGTPEVVYKDTDGWTIITADGKISGLFEETVAVTPSGPVVLTQPQKR